MSVRGETPNTVALADLLDVQAPERHMAGRAIAAALRRWQPRVVRPDLATMRARIARARNGMPRAMAPTALLVEIDDLLTEGYAWALAGDAWSLDAEQQLHELISNRELPIRGRAIRELTRDHAAFEGELIALRRELALLRRDRGRLVGDAAACCLAEPRLAS
jgi:hypothetical protein